MYYDNVQKSDGNLEVIGKTILKVCLFIVRYITTIMSNEEELFEINVIQCNKRYIKKNGCLPRLKEMGRALLSFLLNSLISSVSIENKVISVSEENSL